jgi:hypothetical protein
VAIDGREVLMLSRRPGGGGEGVITP